MLCSNWGKKERKRWRCAITTQCVVGQERSYFTLRETAFWSVWLGEMVRKTVCVRVQIQSSVYKKVPAELAAQPRVTSQLPTSPVAHPPLQTPLTPHLLKMAVQAFFTIIKSGMEMTTWKCRLYIPTNQQRHFSSWQFYTSQEANGWKQSPDLHTNA